VKRRLVSLAVAVLLATLGLSLLTTSGCTTNHASPDPRGVIRGEIVTRNGAEIPTSAVLHVEALDGGDVVAEQIISNPGRQPIPFALKYDWPPADSSRSQSKLEEHLDLRARVEKDGLLLFASDRVRYGRAPVRIALFPSRE
jgi:uncharacterized lipoprotein YbaY